MTGIKADDPIENNALLLDVNCPPCSVCMDKQDFCARTFEQVGNCSAQHSFVSVAPSQLDVGQTALCRQSDSNHARTAGQLSGKAMRRSGVPFGENMRSEIGRDNWHRRNELGERFDDHALFGQTKFNAAKLFGKRNAKQSKFGQLAPQ